MIRARNKFIIAAGWDRQTSGIFTDPMIFPAAQFVKDAGVL